MGPSQRFKRSLSSHVSDNPTNQPNWTGDLSEIPDYESRMFESLDETMKNRSFYDVPDPTNMATRVWFADSDGRGEEDAFDDVSDRSFNAMVFPGAAAEH